MLISKVKNIDHHHARKFGNVFRFIEDLIVRNDSKEFENSSKEIYPEELELKKENVSGNVATFLGLNKHRNQRKTVLYDIIG